MTNRRDLIKNAIALLAVAPLLTLPTFAQAASGQGSIPMKGAVKQRRSPRFLSDYIYDWIIRHIKGSLNKEDSQQILEYLKENPDAARAEIKKVVKQLQSGKPGEMPDEEFAGISIKFRFKWKPPHEFELSLEIEF